MITGTHIIGASLIALLVDRLVLERHVGRTPFSGASTRISTTLSSALPVIVVLTLSSAMTCALVDYLLRPLGAAYLYPMVFAAAIAATAMAGELLLSKWLSPEMRNRVSGRTAVSAAVLGFLVLVPQNHSAGACAISPATGTLDAAIAGAVFLFVALIWNGIREKIDLANDTNSRLSPAQELVAAALTALVLSGVSGSNLFHIIKAP